MTRILVPDNLKTGVVKDTRTEISLNRVHQEMAENYGTAINPARVSAPEDKTTVEDGYFCYCCRKPLFYTDASTKRQSFMPHRAHKI